MEIEWRVEGQEAIYDYSLVLGLVVTFKKNWKGVKFIGVDITALSLHLNFYHFCLFWIYRRYSERVKEKKLIHQNFQILNQSIFSLPATHCPLLPICGPVP